MHVCLRFVVRMYQAQLVFLMFERDSQSQFTLYSSVSVLNKLISLALGKVKWILRAEKTEKNFLEQTKSQFMK